MVLEVKSEDHQSHWAFWGQRMSRQIFTRIHLVVFDVLQFVPKWWTDLPTSRQFATLMCKYLYTTWKYAVDLQILGQYEENLLSLPEINSPWQTYSFKNKSFWLPYVCVKFVNIKETALYVSFVHFKRKQYKWVTGLKLLTALIFLFRLYWKWLKGHNRCFLCSD